MPRFHPVQTAFTSGELSPKVHLGRVDFAKYMSGAETLENWRVFPQGGITRRAGTRFVARVKTTTRTPRLVPFVVSASQAYILEFGHLYIRFYTNGAPITVSGVPVELTTTYVDTDLYQLDVSGQSADVLYLVHPSYPPAKLERYADTIWKLRTVAYAPPPTREFGHRPAGTLTPSALTGTSVTGTSSLNDFKPSDVGRQVLVTGGSNASARAGIKAVTSATVVELYVCDAFVSLVATPAASWKLTDSPLTGVTPGAKSPVGLSTTLTADAAAWKGAAASGYQTGDCSRFVLLNGGMFQITAVTSDTVLQATIKGEASAVTKASAGGWTLEEAAWSAQNGYPTAVNVFEDRFYYGGTTAQPDSLWGSKSGDYENFGFGVLDDDAVAFTLNTPQVNGIRWIRGTRELALSTAGGEFVGTGGADNPITPTNVLFKSETTYGAAAVGPLRVSNVILFLTRSLRKLREFVFSWETQGHVAQDMLLLAEHLTCNATLTQLAYQQDPDSTILATRSDGQLLTCTYLREQEVVAWTRQVTRPGDIIESVAIIPHPTAGRDQLWLATARQIGGTTVRMIEYADDVVPETVHLPDVTTDLLGGGQVWTIGAAEVSTSAHVAVFLDATTVYKFYSSGALRFGSSTDGGATFPVDHITTVNPGPDLFGAEMALNPTPIVYVLNNTTGLWQSADVYVLPDTSTWTRTTIPSGGSALGFKVGVNPNQVLLAGQDGGTALRVWSSADKGVTFGNETTFGGDLVAQALGTQLIASPAASTWLVMNPNSGIVRRSTDNGATWTLITTLTAGTATANTGAILALDATRIVAAVRGQLSTSADGGLTWTAGQDLSADLGNIVAFGSFGSGVVCAVARSLVTVSTIANRYAWRSTDSGVTWASVPVSGGTAFVSANARLTLTTAGQRGVITGEDGTNSFQQYWVCASTPVVTPGALLPGVWPWQSLYTDAAVVYSGDPVTVVSGLSHLEGATVAIVGDGAVYPSQVVSGGAVTVNPAVRKAEVGLGYTSTLVTVPPEVAFGGGTLQALKVRWAEIKVRLLDTLGLTIQGDILPFRTAGDRMNAAPPMFTGDKSVQVTGWEGANQITIQQTQPLPATVLLITGILDVGGG